MTAPTSEFMVKFETPDSQSYFYHSERVYEMNPPYRVGLGKAVPADLRVYRADQVKPVGGLYCYAVFDFTVIESMWVLPEYRKSGLGRLLIDKAKGFALDHRCQRILASTMSFHGVMDFLKKVGFEVVGTVDDCPKGASLYYIQIKL